MIHFSDSLFNDVARSWECVDLLLFLSYRLMKSVLVLTTTPCRGIGTELRSNELRPKDHSEPPALNDWLQSIIVWLVLCWFGDHSLRMTVLIEVSRLVGARSVLDIKIAIFEFGEPVLISSERHSVFHVRCANFSSRSSGFSTTTKGHGVENSRSCQFGTPLWKLSKMKCYEETTTMAL